MSLLTLLSLAGGLALLVVGGDLLVRCAAAVALRAGISRMVIGLTVVAFGTSAPEAAVSAIGALQGQPDIALGNVVGSNIFNTLFILGLCGAIAPLAVSRRLVKIDVAIMILASAALWAMALNGSISRLEALALFAGIVAYGAFQVLLARREAGAEPGGAPSSPPAGRRGPWILQLGGVLLALGILVAGSHLLVSGSVALARAVGLSELVIGLTIVAAGTSLPEVATSVVATYRGHREIAVGNVVGSNIFNIFGVLGVSGTIAPSGISVAPEALAFDIPVMLGVAVLSLPILATGLRIARLEGYLLLTLYVAYTGYLVLSAQDHAALPAYTRVMQYGLLPLAVGGVAVSLFLPRRLSGAGAS